MINEIKQDAKTRMGKSIDSLKVQLNKIRTGRAHVSLLDNITVEYYGVNSPLSQIGNVSTPDARTISISVFDKTMVGLVEKAILKSDLGLNPSSQGTLIRIPLPPLTEERRRDLVKVVGGEIEAGKVAIRNIRRDANSDIKSLNKDKDISDDEARNGEDEIQKVTNEYIKLADEIASAKEKELMEI